MTGFRSRRVGAIAVGTALLASGALATQAQAVQKTLSYECIYPFVDEQPLSVDLTASIPTTFPAETETPAFALSAVATAKGDTATALATVGAKEIEGSTKASARIEGVGQNLPLKVPLAIPRQPANVDPVTKEFVLNVSGSTPPINFLNPGPAKILVGGLALTLKAYTKTGKVVILDPSSTKVPQTGDSDPETFEVTCALKPAETSTGFSLLETVEVTPYVEPGTPTPTPVATPVVTPTPVATPVVTPTPVATPVVTPTPVATPKVTPTPVATPVVTPTPVATPKVTPTPVATPVVTPTPVATPKVTPTPVATPVVTPTPVATPKVTPTPVATPVVTPAPSKAPTVTKVAGAGWGYIGGIALIQGSNFNNVKSVKFGTLSAPSGFAIGTSQLIVIAPAQKPGTVKVTVETPAGVSQENVTFTYNKLF